MHAVKVKHNGVEYESITAAARAHGLSGDLVVGRVNKGWTLARALTTPNNANLKKRAFFNSETNTKICAKCGTDAPIESFYRHRQTADGYHSWCKACCKKGNETSRNKLYSSFEGRVATFLRTCQVSALKRGQEFSLTRADFLEMWEKQRGVCAYSGIEMATAANLPTSVSVERIDSSRGYVPENTILVCRDINRMKSDLTGEQFYEFCKAVALWLSDDNLERNVDFCK